MRVEVRKLYLGNIELRDYDVEECIKKGETVEVHFDGDKMTLSPEDLVKRKKSVSPVSFQSKVGGKNYHLVAYEWQPDEVEL